MSVYEWEAGTIQLPKAQFAKIRKQFIADYNDIREREMNAANAIREQALKQFKGKHITNWLYAMQDFAERNGVSYDTLYMMVPDEKKKPKKLTKKAMKLANSKTMCFPLGDGGAVIFDAEDKTVSYSVPENNHACEHARESHVGKLFFRTMARIEWTRGSGGCLYGNDEYHRDAGYGNDGGGNYVTQTFGKTDKKARYKY